MAQIKTKERISFARRVISLGVILTFTLSMITPPQVHGQPNPLSGLNLPVPGAMVPLSPGYDPVLIKGVKIYPDNPLRFDFIVDIGDDRLGGESLKEESSKLIKYFLASLTVPENDLWVNLSPYERERIIPAEFGITEMGRDLLAQDYLLKQITATLMYPEKELGQAFWDRVHQRANQLYGTTDIPTDTFNKVWIVPDTAVVFVTDDTAVVVESRLKVMLEEDYLAFNEYDEHVISAQRPGPSANSKLDTGDRTQAKLSTEIIREIMIPEIEKEVNEGENFAPLRQIYHSLILATWFKRNLRESFLGRRYVDHNLVRGVDTEDKNIKEKIYQQYVNAFKRGVYNYIKEEYDPLTQKVIPRKYFSGGMNFGDGMALAYRETNDPGRVASVVDQDRAMVVSSELEAETSDQAMLARPFQNIDQIYEELPQRIQSILKNIADEMELPAQEREILIRSAADMIGMIEEFYSRMKDIGGQSAFLKENYHNHLHHMAVTYGALTLASRAGLMTSSRDVKAVFLAGMLHDFHMREVLSTTSDGQTRVNPALVKETLGQIADLMGVPQGEYSVPAIDNARYSLITQRDKQRFRTELGRFLGDERIEDVFNEVVALIRRTDFASDVPQALFKYRSEAQRIRAAVEEEIQDQGQTIDQIRSYMQKEFSRLKSSIRSQRLLDGAGQTTASLAWVNRQEEIEVSYLNALDKVSFQWQSRAHELAAMLEVADHSVSLWIGNDAVADEIVEGLQREIPDVTLEGSYAFFVRPNILLPGVLRRLQHLPAFHKIRLMERIERLVEIGEEIKTSGTAKTSRQDWEDIRTDILEQLNNGTEPFDTDTSRIAISRFEAQGIQSILESLLKQRGQLRPLREKGHVELLMESVVAIVTDAKSFKTNRDLGVALSSLFSKYGVDQPRGLVSVFLRELDGANPVLARHSADSAMLSDEFLSSPGPLTYEALNEEGKGQLRDMARRMLGRNGTVEITGRGTYTVDEFVRDVILTATVTRSQLIERYGRDNIFISLGSSPEWIYRTLQVMDPSLRGVNYIAFTKDQLLAEDGTVIGSLAHNEAQARAYVEYLAENIGYDALASDKKIIVSDMVVSGESFRTFIPLLEQWAVEEGIDLSGRIVIHSVQPAEAQIDYGELNRFVIEQQLEYNPKLYEALMDADNYFNSRWTPRFTPSQWEGEDSPFAESYYVQPSREAALLYFKIIDQLNLWDGSAKPDDRAMLADVRINEVTSPREIENVISEWLSEYPDSKLNKEALNTMAGNEPFRLVTIRSNVADDELLGIAFYHQGNYLIEHDNEAGFLYHIEFFEINEALADYTLQENDVFVRLIAHVSQQSRNESERYGAVLGGFVGINITGFEEEILQNLQKVGMTIAEMKDLLYFSIDQIDRMVDPSGVNVADMSRDSEVEFGDSVSVDEWIDLKDKKAVLNEWFSAQPGNQRYWNNRLRETPSINILTARSMESEELIGLAIYAPGDALINLPDGQGNGWVHDIEYLNVYGGEPEMTPEVVESVIERFISLVYKHSMESNRGDEFINGYITLISENQTGQNLAYLESLGFDRLNYRDGRLILTRRKARAIVDKVEGLTGSPKKDGIDLSPGDRDFAQMGDERDGTRSRRTDKVGGIDFNPAGLDLRIQGREIELDVPANLRRLETMPIEGFSPVIFQVVPVTNLPLLLGIKEEEEKAPPLAASREEPVALLRH